MLPLYMWCDLLPHVRAGLIQHVVTQNIYMWCDLLHLCACRSDPIPGDSEHRRAAPAVGIPEAKDGRAARKHVS